MFSMCSELAPRARIPDTKIPQLMQPWSVLNFAHPPHEKKGETHEGQKLKIKRLLVHFRVKDSSLNIGLASPEEWKDRDCHPLHVWWSLFTQMDGIGLLI